MLWIVRDVAVVGGGERRRRRMVVVVVVGGGGGGGGGRGSVCRGWKGCMVWWVWFGGVLYGCICMYVCMYVCVYSGVRLAWFEWMDWFDWMDGWGFVRVGGEGVWVSVGV